jgi:hypothetical protein
MAGFKRILRRPLVAYLVAILVPVRRHQSLAHKAVGVGVGASPYIAAGYAAVRTDHWKAAVVGLAVLAAVQVYVGRSLMARLVAEKLPLTVTAGLEPTPSAENFLTLDVTYDGEQAEITTEATWVQFDSYGSHQPVWLPALTATAMLGPARRTAKLRVEARSQARRNGRSSSGQSPERVRRTYQEHIA